MSNIKILGLFAENFKKIRVMEIHPNGRLVQITGKNGAGKTSVLDAIQFGLKGRKALPAKAVRKGQQKMTVKLDLGEFTIERTLTAEGAIPSLQIEMAKGHERTATPQDFLDAIFDELTFDPLAFVKMTPKEQVAMLRKTAKVDIDFEAIAEANRQDYEARKVVNKEADQIDARIKAMTVLEGLPKDKLDEAAILAKLHEAGEANRKAQEIFKAKQQLGVQLGVIENAVRTDAQFREDQKAKIVRLEKELKAAKDALKMAEEQAKKLHKEHAAASAEYAAAPSGEPIDVTALTAELQAAQRTNQAIDMRQAYDALSEALKDKRLESRKLTNQMEAREEQKRVALSKAKIPVEGISFDEVNVSYKGLPLENLGEAEQISISAQIGMAANPKLKILCIRNGEALDEDGLKVLADLAEKHDFQIWMARVDSSGKVGIVLEDGMVVAENAEALEGK